MDKKEMLSGGRIGKIFKESERVIRPANKWTPHVHSFLRFLYENGFKNIPIPYEITEDGKEIVSFVEGDVYNNRLPDFLQREDTLVSVAKMLRRFHDIGELYIKNLTGREDWMLPVICPIEVMCHGDFAPYNVTFMDDKASGMIDFDTLHPGPRIWDIAYAIYRFVPFVSPHNPDYCEDINRQIAKARIFIDAYGLEAGERKKLPGMMVERLESLVGYMKQQAELGNHDFIRNIQDGHLDLYMQDIQYIKEHEKEFYEY